METYIAILRGINVSGQKKIKMADLKSALADLNFINVTTYIQSGNIVFQENKCSTETLSGKISGKIKEVFGFDVPVITRNLDEWKHAVHQNPFLKRKGIDMKRVYLTFLTKQPENHKKENIEAMDFTPDEFIIIGKEIYLHCPIMYGKSKISNNFFEQKLKVTATTRNMNTVYKLIEIAEAIN